MSTCTFLSCTLTRPMLWVALLCAVTLGQANAQQVSEPAQLESLIRQLNAIQSQIKHSTYFIDVRARYYFDYQRLNSDLDQIRNGIQNYLVPLRAQPRDPVELIGHYQREQNGGKP